MSHSPIICGFVLILTACGTTTKPTEEGLAKAIKFAEVEIGAREHTLEPLGLQGIDIDSEVRVRIEKNELEDLLPKAELNKEAIAALRGKVQAQAQLLSQVASLSELQQQAIEHDRTALKLQADYRIWLHQRRAAMIDLEDTLSRRPQEESVRVWLHGPGPAISTKFLTALRIHALSRVRASAGDARSLRHARRGLHRVVSLGLALTPGPVDPLEERPELQRIALTSSRRAAARKAIAKAATSKVLKADSTEEIEEAVAKVITPAFAVKTWTDAKPGEIYAAVQKALTSEKTVKALEELLKAKPDSHEAAAVLAQALAAEVPGYYHASLKGTIVPILKKQLAPTSAQLPGLARQLGKAQDIFAQQPTPPSTAQGAAIGALAVGDRRLKAMAASLGALLEKGEWFGSANLNQLRQALKAQSAGLLQQLEALEQAGGLQDYSFTIKATLVREGVEISLVPVPGYSTFEGEGRTTTPRVIVDNRLKNDSSFKQAMADMKAQAAAQAKMIAEGKKLLQKSKATLKAAGEELAGILERLEGFTVPAEFSTVAFELKTLLAEGNATPQEKIEALLTKLTTAAARLPKETPVTKHVVNSFASLIKKALAGLQRGDAAKTLALAAASNLDDHTIVKRADQTPNTTVRVPNVPRVEGDVVRVRIALFKGKKETPDSIVDTHVSEFLLERVGPSLQVGPVAHLVDRQGRGDDPNNQNRQKLLPTAGVAAVFHPWHCRTRGPGSRFWNFLEPGIAAGVHLLDFEQDNDIEVGVSLGVTLFGDLISAGYGWNASVSEDRGYLYFGFGFGSVLQSIYKSLSAPANSGK